MDSQLFMSIRMKGQNKEEDMTVFRETEVFYKNEPAGHLAETSGGYTFQYDPVFLKKNTPISVSLPPRKEPYVSKELFPFFKGLLPEGWYLDIVSATQKVDPQDPFGILIATASEDTIGAVTVRQREH